MRGRNFTRKQGGQFSPLFLFLAFVKKSPAERHSLFIRVDIYSLSILSFLYYFFILIAFYFFFIEPLNEQKNVDYEKTRP